MIFPLTLHAGANREMGEAADYYRRVDPQLAADLLAEIERSFQIIGERPKSCMLIAQNTRRKIIDRFPYGIIFREHPGEIRILAIAHLKRRPFYWAGRV